MRVRVNNRKRFFGILSFLVVLFLMTINAYAEIPCLCNNPPDQCTCFIQLGDKGLAVQNIIACLKKKGYLRSDFRKKEFTSEVKQAVLKLQEDNNLECTGWMDDETLNVLLHDILPDGSVKHSAQYWESIYYVPTDGGIRYHSDPECCGMYHPRLISGVNAESLGLQHCGWDSCKKTSTITYTMLGLTPRELPESYYIAEDGEDNAEFIGSDMPSRSLQTEEVEAVYIGNKNSHVYHLESCSSVRKMSEKNKVFLYSRDEALAEGYQPCGRCNP